MGERLVALRGNGKTDLPWLERELLVRLAGWTEAREGHARAMEAAILAWCKCNDASRCLAHGPGIDRRGR